jgi:hypothetical protein
MSNEKLFVPSNLKGTNSSKQIFTQECFLYISDTNIYLYDINLCNKC